MPRIHGAALNEVDWGGARFDNIPPLIIRLELAQALHPAGKQAPDYAVGDRGSGAAQRPTPTPSRICAGNRGENIGRRSTIVAASIAR
jgi:hypothetical protein